MMRIFKLKNAAGYEYNLTDKEHFMYDPSDLGFAYNTNYQQVGPQFVQMSELLKQPRPAGVMKFNDYEGYNSFIKFIQKRPLVLIYIPDNKEFRLNCKVASLEKTEKKAGGWLHCKIKFEGIGTWYRYSVLKKNTSTYKEKTYNYSFPFQYTDSTINSMEITTESTIKSPMIITFIGPCKNPSWVHYLNGIRIASGKVFVELRSGEKMKVSSVMPYSIVKTDSTGNELEDLYGASDFSTQRFLWLEQGGNLITIAHEGIGDLNAVVEVYEYYESV